MDFVTRLKELGFAKVIVLDGQACGIEEKTLILALWTYTAEKMPGSGEAWIHPYYRVSHHAYQAARGFVEECREAGHSVAIRDDVRLKPIFARLPGMSQGRNTLSYIQGTGSRFYAKAFALDERLQVTCGFETEQHSLHCGNCTRCMQVCPTHAIDMDGFHMERCIRYWMMPGKPVPEEIRAQMGNRLIGCDECQRCCPHNPPLEGETGPTVPLRELLENHKAVAETLKGEIGANLAIPNRVLAQSCMIAGCSQRSDLLPALEQLEAHPSEAVREHAAWAKNQLNKLQD